MHCFSVDECFEQISAYCNGDSTGYPLLVNTDSFDVLQSVVSRLAADKGKQCIYVSQNTQRNGLPDVTRVYPLISKEGEYVLIGVSQALMLRSEIALEAELNNLLSFPVKGKVIILLTHCKKHLENYMSRDLRTKNRIVLIEGEKSVLPQIKLAEDENLCVGFKPLQGIQGLLDYLERATDAKISRHPVLTVLSRFKPALFKGSMFSVSASVGVYEALCQKYADLITTEYKFGTDKQWRWLMEQILDADSFSEYICSVFGSTVNLISHLSEVVATGNENQTWLLWLALKVFGAQNNRYLTHVLANNEAVVDFAKAIYFDLLEYDIDAHDYWVCYAERSRIIDSLPEDLALVNSYCNSVGVKEKDAIYYLTSGTDREEYELMNCLSMYNYSEEELVIVLSRTFPELYKYLKKYEFDSTNTKLPESEGAFRAALTQYFHVYKQQKIVNRIEDDFLHTVSEYAVSRPFNKLCARSSIFNSISKDGTSVFFFDALGVEYLSYIQAKCEEYGLITETAIARCELPSITSENKEFVQVFPGVKKVSDLDELKHHSQIYDYETCRLPIHVFRELEIIDRELKRINAQLIQGTMQKAIIVSDHGASRLAVIYGHESESGIELEEKGLHSGRCCKTSADPKLNCAAYENGYAILANYDRFKGGRQANLEVHGGATLEEVVVPIITLYRKPDDVKYCFTDPVIKFKLGKPAQITLFCNIPMSNPKLQVNGVFYTGAFVGDKKHAEFTMPELKRTKEYVAELYEGDKKLGISLTFSIERGTKEKNLF